MEDYRLDQSGQEVQDILNGAAMQSDLTAETERATEAEQTLQDNIDAEATRAQGAEGTLQDNIDTEEARAKAAEKQNADDIDAIEEKIPSGASSSNKLATEEYVADAVATATATFRGTYNLVSDLHLNVTATEQQISAALAGAISTADNNDYCFILVPTSSETPTEIKEIDRYKFNGTAWAFEYKLNNSGFNAAQWAAINSGITSGDVAKLAALPTNAQLTTLLAGLQSDINGEEARAKGAEGTLQDNIDAEETRAKAAEKQNADDIDAIEAVLPSTASSENKVATESEIDSLSAAIEAILLLIPSAATSLNKLADKAFVNSSIATATATFRGTYNLVDDLGLTTSATHAQIATALAGAISTADNNDYAFVQIPTSYAMPTEIAKTERYKFNGTAWEYEYDLNNSGFTADQWAAINSGITQALVTKLSALPTNAELTTELGTLTNGITTINQKIPNAASQANKLVDTAAMESYIVEVLNVLTISYNVTSTDGHVTFHIEQVDGKITSVTLTTSDIASDADLNLKASQADLTALANRVTTAEGNITTLNGNLTSLTGRVSTNETDIAQLQAAYEALTQSDIIIGALPASGVDNKIYRVPGTSSYSDYMWNGSTWVLMATYNNAIDPRPKKASQNLVTSGGVFDNMGALDVSELNATENPHTLAQYVNLSAAIAAIPTDYQKGGMSIKYVRSSDNKYIRFDLIADEFTTDVTKWQGVDDKPVAGSVNLVESGGVALELNKINGLNKSGSATFEATGIKTLITDIDLPVGSKYTIDISASGLVWSSMFLFDQNDFAQSENTKNIPSAGKYTFTVRNNAITELRIYLVAASAYGTLSALLTIEGELDKKADAEDFAEYVETKQVEDFSQNLANAKVFGKTVEKANTTSIKTSTPANGYYNIYGVFTEDNDFYYQSVVIDHSKCYHIVNDNQAFSIATLVLFGSNNEVLFIDNNRYVDEYFVFNNEVHHFAISSYVKSWRGVLLEESDISVNNGGLIVNGHKEVSAASLASGGVLTLTNIPNVQKNKTIAFYARLGTFDGVTIRHGEHGDYANGIIKVDNTNIYLYPSVGDDSTPSSTIPHGLTINSFVSILIDVNEWFEGKVTVTTLGGEFTTTFTTFMGSSGNITATSNGSSLTLAKLVFGCVDFTRDVWMFGDSYFVMWPYYAINKKHANFYQDGFAGRTAQGALTSLQNALQFGFIPKTIVWFMGMNNPDSGGVVNSAWNTAYNSLVNICENYGIELVLTTIPSTPTMNNDKKNAIVKNSGYRYIDIAGAVGADISTSWYSGTLSSDNVHPTSTGCVVIAARVMADLPEIKNP